MDIAKEQVLEIVKEELELLEGQQAFIAYAHLRAYDKDTLNEGLEDIFSFFNKAVSFGLDSVTDVVKNKAISYILQYLGLPKDGFVNKALSETLEQFSMDDWKKILEGEAKCSFFSNKIVDAVTELLVAEVHREAVGVLDRIYNKIYGEVGHLLGKVPNKGAQAVSTGIGLAKKLPVAAKLGMSPLGPIAAVAATPLGSELSQNAIRKLPQVKQFRKQASKYICDAVDKFTSKQYKLPDLKKFIDI